MSALILGGALVVTQLMLGAAMMLAGWRMLRGPRAQDRVLGLDSLYSNGLLMVITFGVRTGSSYYFEAALVIGLLGFASTVAMAKFLMRGEVIE
jgi:multicomponent K+:H+ antiporter subunit F